MKRIEKLKREAIEATKWRGHNMRRFKKQFGDSYISYCKNCGSMAYVKPGYSYEIIGDAVAINCTN